MREIEACNTVDNLVYIYRNPIDMINSWTLAPKEFDPAWDISEEWFSASKKKSN